MYNEATNTYSNLQGISITKEESASAEEAEAASDSYTSNDEQIENSVAQNKKSVKESEQYSEAVGATISSYKNDFDATAKTGNPIEEIIDDSHLNHSIKEQLVSS